jgi:hypothetical protein
VVAANVPGEHATPSGKAVEGQAKPSGQLEQLIAPVADAYEPAGQSEQAAELSRLAYRPAAHGEQVAELEAPAVVEYRPSAQPVQDATPVVDE